MNTPEPQPGSVLLSFCPRGTQILIKQPLSLKFHNLGEFSSKLDSQIGFWGIQANQLTPRLSSSWPTGHASKVGTARVKGANCCLMRVWFFPLSTGVWRQTTIELQLPMATNPCSHEALQQKWASAIWRKEELRRVESQVLHGGSCWTCGFPVEDNTVSRCVCRTRRAPLVPDSQKRRP